jgi:hypothetical protein
MPTVRFFAVDEDLRAVLAAIEASMDLQYVTTRGFPRQTVDRYLRAADIPALSIATHESGGGCQPYLVAPRDAGLVPRRITLASGESVDAYDQFASDRVATLVAAGRWKPDVVLSGTFGTTHRSVDALRLVNLFRRETSKRFTRINAFWVGPAAERALDAGQRLAGAEQSPTLYDLRRRG